MSLIVIPWGYEDLPKSQQSGVIPVCIDSRDSSGSEIDRRWFTQGVAPAYGRLLNLSRSFLGDVLRASEIAERAVHALWRTHRGNLSPDPKAQVEIRATWEARTMRSDRSRYEQRALLPVVPEALRDQTDHSQAYAASLDVDRMLERMRQYGYDMEAIAHGLMFGKSYEEIAEELGVKTKTINKRIQRWRRKELSAIGSQRRCRQIAAGGDQHPPDSPSEP